MVNKKCLCNRGESAISNSESIILGINFPHHALRRLDRKVQIILRPQEVSRIFAPHSKARMNNRK